MAFKGQLREIFGKPPEPFPKQFEYISNSVEHRVTILGSPSNTLGNALTTVGDHSTAPERQIGTQVGSTWVPASRCWYPSRFDVGAGIAMLVPKSVRRGYRHRDVGALVDSSTGNDVAMLAPFVYIFDAELLFMVVSWMSTCPSPYCSRAGPPGRGRAIPCCRARRVAARTTTAAARTTTAATTAAARAAVRAATGTRTTSLLLQGQEGWRQGLRPRLRRDHARGRERHLRALHHHLRQRLP